MCGGDQHGLQDRLDRQRGPERPLSAEFVVHTEHKKTGRKCGSDLEIIQNVAKASQKRSADETLIPIMGMRAPCTLSSCGGQIGN